MKYKEKELFFKIQQLIDENICKNCENEYECKHKYCDSVKKALEQVIKL